MDADMTRPRGLRTLALLAALALDRRSAGAQDISFVPVNGASDLPPGIRSGLE